MSSRLGAPARLIWSLAGSGLGTAIAANGNSGAWPTPPYQPTWQNNLSPVDLRDVEDVWMTAYVTGLAGTSPTLTVALNAFDDLGNLWQVAALPAINAAGLAGGKQLAIGKHGASAGSYAVFPQWGQVAWTVGGTSPSFTGVGISLWAR